MQSNSFSFLDVVQGVYALSGDLQLLLQQPSCQSLPVAVRKQVAHELCGLSNDLSRAKQSMVSLTVGKASLVDSVHAFFDYVDRIQEVVQNVFRRTDGYPVFQACVNSHLSRVCALAGLKDSLISDAEKEQASGFRFQMPSPLVLQGVEPVNRCSGLKRTKLKASHQAASSSSQMPTREAIEQSEKMAAALIAQEAMEKKESMHTPPKKDSKRCKGASVMNGKKNQKKDAQQNDPVAGKKVGVSNMIGFFSQPEVVPMRQARHSVCADHPQSHEAMSLSHAAVSSESQAYDQDLAIRRNEALLKQEEADLAWAIQESLRMHKEACSDATNIEQSRNEATHRHMGADADCSSACDSKEVVGSALQYDDKQRKSCKMDAEVAGAGALSAHDSLAEVSIFRMNSRGMKDALGKGLMDRSEFDALGLPRLP